MRPMTLATRLALGYVAAIAALVTVVAITLVSFQAARTQTSAVHDNHIPSIDAAKRLLVRLERMENAEFMYFVPNQEIKAWTTRFDQDAREFDQAFVDAEVVSHSSEEIALYAEMGRHYGAFIHVDARMRRLLAAGRSNDARNLNATESLEAISDLREAARRFYALNLAESARARAAADDALGRMAGAALSVGAIGVLAALGLWRRATRALVEPVQALRHASEQLATGNFVRVEHPAAARTVELASLEAAFNRMAAESQGARETLEHEVAAQTIDLRDANQQLELLVDELRSLDRMKSNLLAVVSHELLTPINIIMGFADLLDDDPAGQLTSAQREAVREILAGSERLARMVRNTLLYARLESGGITLVGTACPPDDMLASAAARAATAAANAGTQLAWTAEADMPAAWTDPERLAQVLDELIDNAVKFAGAGGHVSVTAAAESGEIAFEVKDDGPGIPAEMLARIFQPFFQKDLTSTRVHGGLGLGLAIAHRLVAKMGGMLMVASKPGEGATFRFTVPRMGRPAHPRPRETADADI